MTSLIDFSQDMELFSNLDGAAQKTLVLHNETPYIIKFGNPLDSNPKRPDQGSYRHTPVSEHLACEIIDALDIPVQKTLLGTFHGREVVACEDFTAPLKPNVELVPFSRIENTIISSSERGRFPHLDNIAHVFAEHPIFDKFRKDAIERYWDTFVIDALIANPDRHGGNWGYLMSKDSKTGILTNMIALAPIYDCGSSLAASISEDAMKRIISDEDEQRERALGWPQPALLVDGERPSYHAFLLSDNGQDARNALIRISNQIANLDVKGIVSSVPGISQTRKDFYEATINSRIEHILQPAYEMACAEHNLTPKSLLPKETTKTVREAKEDGSLNLPAASYAANDNEVQFE